MRDLLRDEFFIKLICNPDEDTRHYWQRWLERHPERREEFELARQTVQSVKYKTDRKLSEDDYDRMFMRIRAFKQELDERATSGRFPEQRDKRPVFLRAAAAILFLLTLAVGATYMISRDASENVALNDVEWVETVVPAGAKKTVRLGDGTIIRLNAGSSIAFPERFGADTRPVTLKGEAFFDVAKDENRPFIIKTGDITTKVLGTSFNIRHHEEEEHIEIALVSGKVRVNDALGNEMLLQPAEMLVYSKSTQTHRKSGFDEKLITAWQDNILVFEKASMRQIKDKLERWYGVEITLALSRPVAGHYSGEYHNEPLEVVLQGIGYASGIHYSVDHNKVIIKN
ncbi:MAG: FecR domain-containing protein [Cytophagales bacterium]|nr:FecR domain-containing protein [Cytophagales bacterium]